MIRAVVTVAAIGLTLGLSGCQGKIGDSAPSGSGPIAGDPIGGGGGADGGRGGGPGGGADGGSGPTCTENRNDEIRLAIQGACISCHAAGSRPFFSSLAAFENGLVWNRRYVIPGDPDQSLLIALLEARAAGTYPQMPPGQLYQAAVDARLSTVTLDELKQWIRDLPPEPPIAAAPSPDAFSVRRLTAEEMVSSLMEQLGLTLADFVSNPDMSGQSGELAFRHDRLGMWPVDPAPGVSGYHQHDGRAAERFMALGGPSTTEFRSRDQGLAPAAVQTLIQVSQAWCSMAVTKAGNTAILRHVTLAETSATSEASIRRNIQALQLRMLGEEATPAQLDHLYRDLYLKLETESTAVAWTGVCASFVRHPQWLTF